MRKVLRHYWQKLKHLRRKQAILVIGTFVFVMTSYALILRAVTLDNDTASSEPGILLAMKMCRKWRPSQRLLLH